MRGSGIMDMAERYQKSKDFREYVDRFCTTYKRTVEDALQLALVREVAAYYQDVESGRISDEKSTYALMGECK